MISGDGVRVAHPLFFQVDGGGSIPTSPLQLKVEKIGVKKARDLNALWHSKLPIYESGFCLKAKVCYAAIYDGIYYAVAIWDIPSARHLPHDSILELKRFAIADDAPKNTASRLLKVMTNHIKQEFQKISTLISYQDIESHSGVIYKASGWKKGRTSVGGTWASPGTRDSGTNNPRLRPDLNKATGPKIRWERPI